MRRRRLQWPPILMLTPPVLIFVVFFVSPLAYLLAFSVFRFDEVLLARPAFVMDNYAAVLADPYGHAVVMRTLRVGAVTTLLTLLLGYVLAYRLLYARGLERTLLTAIVLSPLVISEVILSYGWFAILAPNSGIVTGLSQALHLAPVRLMNTEPAIVIGLTQSTLIYMTLTLQASLIAIDPVHFRAAAALGASPVQVFRRVTLPLSLPGVLSGCLLVFALSCSSFAVPQFLGGNQVPLLSTYIYNLDSTVINYPQAAAASVVLLVLVAASMYGFTAIVERLRDRMGITLER